MGWTVDRSQKAETHPRAKEGPRRTEVAETVGEAKAEGTQETVPVDRRDRSGKETAVAEKAPGMHREESRERIALRPRQDGTATGDPTDPHRGAIMAGSCPQSQQPRLERSS